MIHKYNLYMLYQNRWRNALPGAYPVHSGYPFQPPLTQPAFHPAPPIGTDIPVAGKISVSNMRVFRLTFDAYNTRCIKLNSSYLNFVKFL